jgi:ribosomal protein S18 acetylase RimI-like enzyme
LLFGFSEEEKKRVRKAASPTRRSELIRRAVPVDAELLAVVHVETWRTAYRGILGDDYLDALDIEGRTRWWAGLIADGAIVHIAEGDDDVVGYCWVDSSNDAEWGEVVAIYVHPDHWGEGHGHRLLATGEESLRHEGYTKALLWVLEANHRARRFYERQGWQPGKPFRIEEIGGAQVTEIRYQTAL